MSQLSAKRQKVKGEATGRHAQGSAITDPRFANIQSDPRYRLPSKRKTHVKLDKRFSRILQDDDFTQRAKVDRYGRPLQTDSERDRFKRRYEFEDEEDEGSNDADNAAKVQRKLQKTEKVFDHLRDGGVEGSSSSEESSSEEEDDLEEERGEETHPQIGDGDVPMGEVSSRVAVVNLDWDNIRAEDLMAVFSSFLPTGGRLLKVSIYPSEFGRERMDREEMEGPPKEIFATGKANETGSETEGSQEDDDMIKDTTVKADDGQEFDSAKLRQYQLERLRYFYAVLTFSSSHAAKAIYDATDGTEYLSTANFFDLRFVPDETDFSNERPREECEKIPDSYRPNEFVTDALQHSKVKLTWDAEDVSRKDAQARAFRGGRKEIEENDLKAYLGTDSSEEDEESAAQAASPSAASGDIVSKKEEERKRMRVLLGLPAESSKRSREKDGPVGDLQVTFSSGLSGPNGDKNSVFENEPIVEETTVEKYVRRERERKQKRKGKHKTLGEDAGDSRKRDDVAILAPESASANVEADLGFEDPFFAAPKNEIVSASKLRKEKRVKKRAEREAEEAVSAANRAELELLMVDDQETGVKHFDMNEIEKAEKLAKKGKMKKKSKGKQGEVMELRDDFKVDTQDPRFARLYEHHEFAIDPTNPRFKSTDGMKALLDEGRKRRKERLTRGGDDENEDTSPARKLVQTSRRDSDVNRLVEKVKATEHV